MKKRITLSVLLLFILSIFSACELDSTDSKLASSAPVSAVSSDFAVTYIDVGQADAALVSCEGKHMLIDGGNVEDSSVIVSFLSSKNVNYIDYVINSHPDEDHVGGLAGVLAKFSVGHAYSSVSQYSKTPFNNYKKYANAQGLEIEVPKAGDSFNLGSSKVDILSPHKDYGDVNDNSIVLKVTYGATTFMFTGDISIDVEDDLVDMGLDLSTTVLKVAHHGSKHSTGYIWLRESMPEYAVISVGKDNRYGHPTENTLSRLRDAEVNVYRTDLQGNITAVSDGKNVSFQTYLDADASSVNPTIKDKEEQDLSYIGNINSKTFHSPSCTGLPAEKNRVYFASRKEALNEGYTPCQKCSP
ncbi:MAG: MBL fold metallo-hydrolase [Clostridia bacterium]|nr:MBL fold metallo-hydrolase [Clostridia bacterium]